MIGSLRTKHLKIVWNRIRRDLFTLLFKGLEIFSMLEMIEDKAEGYVQCLS